MNRQARFHWTLEPEGFGRLLALLAPDLESAARRYEDLRTRLVRVFEWRGFRQSEELADQTIDRVVRKIQEGLDLQGTELIRYAGGVARHIAQETWRRERRERVGSADAERPPFVPGRHSTTDFRLAQLEGCLAEMDPVDRDLILRYYTSDPDDRIRNRRALAEELGLRANALRIRAFRIRRRLFERVQSQAAGVGEVQT